MQELKRSFADLKYSIAREKILNEVFDQLYEEGYDFASETITLFHSEAEKSLTELTARLDQEIVNFHMLEVVINRLKGSGLIIGAARLADACLTMATYCDASNKQGCVVSLNHVKEEYQLLMSKIESIRKLENEIIAAGGSI
ncbi:histidine-containing phosphotransfer protein 1-like isoform X2 [Dioscorea cayenensis subsp. rotundata]|uniref:Histidine-containing phosphotransfer protein n=1 Tax=Dioscorea cayennensis subsp. rotundata TaxID=55577 RepID=A0AB40BIA3_DIOCR|nr:histidine-containing phosphotransfer protein 1-like isoform X2 [Dioscorea cayenensis subsp. rotundata]